MIRFYEVNINILGMLARHMCRGRCAHGWRHQRSIAVHLQRAVTQGQKVHARTAKYVTEIDFQKVSNHAAFTKTDNRPDQTRRWPNAGLMLGLRLRRWPNIKPTLGGRLVVCRE